ncbi:L-lactate permease [Castellaniella defragrans]|uniref:L-lactate permease n=1 Tax=Castellaniella defragrans TaxID=75697 RepID=UPI002AFE3885|nr:L-lactate permease [Castellaniella defragrans]
MLGETLKELAIRSIDRHGAGLRLHRQLFRPVRDAALALPYSGHAFAFFSPFLGWLGVFLRSDRRPTPCSRPCRRPGALGVPEVLLVAANSTGGVTGKMISPQSIAIACAAVGLVGRESDLLRFTVKIVSCLP